MILARISRAGHRAPAFAFGAIERTDVGGVIAPAAFPSLQIAVDETFE
jgi:hypothetical protein